MKTTDTFTAATEYLWDGKAVRLLAETPDNAGDLPVKRVIDGRYFTVPVDELTEKPKRTFRNLYRGRADSARGSVDDNQNLDLHAEAIWDDLIAARSGAASTFLGTLEFEGDKVVAFHPKQS